MIMTRQIKTTSSRKLVAAVLSSVLVVISFASTSWAAPKIGTSSAVRGDVFVTTSGARRKAQVRDAISLQDKVLTKEDSALQVLLLDRTTFTVGQNASLTIDKFVYDPTTSQGQVSAKVAKGAFRFMSGNIGRANPTNASVSTPSATIGIRGTFFEGIVGEDAVALAGLAGINTANANFDGASITVLRGPRSGSNTLDNAGIIQVANSVSSITLVRPGYAVFAPSAGAAPIGPFKLTQDMLDYLDFFLRSEPSGPPVNLADVEPGGVESGQRKFERPVDPFDDDKDDGTTDPNVPGTPSNTVEPDQPVGPVAPGDAAGL